MEPSIPLHESNKKNHSKNEGEDFQLQTFSYQMNKSSGWNVQHVHVNYS